MKRLLYVAVLCSVTNLSEAGYFQWQRQMRKFTCSEGGERICSENCFEIKLCSGDGSGGFDEHPFDTCDPAEGQLCGSGYCVPADQSDCARASTTTPRASIFQCNDAGAFPDPRDCTIFYICTDKDAEAAVKFCESPWAYNPLTYDCSLSRSHRVCEEGPIPECSDPDQEGVVSENPVIYYRCDDDLVPQMYRCHHGQVYDTDKRECVNKTQSTTTFAPTGSDVTSTSKYPELSSTEPTTTASSSPTRSTLASDSTTVTPLASSTLDDSSTASTHDMTSIESTTGPSPNSSPGGGSATSSIITSEPPLSNSPSDSGTITPVITTEPSLTSTPGDSISSAIMTESSLTSGPGDSSTSEANTSTPDGPMSTTPAPPIEGSSCDQPDQVVPDPHDCHSYYLCLTIWFHLTCIEGYYFNVDTGNCDPGDC